MHRPGAYVATVVSADEVCHVVRRLGAGERAAAAVAARQLAVITAAQLMGAGLRRGAIAARRRRGALHQLHRGVFLWGGATPLPGALELAGCLACWPACASHASAAALWALTAAIPDDVQITVAGHNCRSRAGLSVHRVRELAPQDIGDVRGIPVTSPARTLVDFAAGHDGHELEHAVSEAFARQLVTERELRLALGPGRAGAAAVRALLDTLRGPRITRSHAERLLLDLVRRAGLPLPRTNVRVEGFLVDAYWPQQRLIVECDGYAVHSHRGAFERDRYRDQVLVAAGYRVMRVTWRQLSTEPLVVVANLTRALT